MIDGERCRVNELAMVSARANGLDGGVGNSSSASDLCTVGGDPGMMAFVCNIDRGTAGERTVVIDDDLAIDNPDRGAPVGVELDVATVDLIWLLF